MRRFFEAAFHHFRLLFDPRYRVDWIAAEVERRIGERIASALEAVHEK